MKIQYHNWSGITLHQGDTVIGFDLYGEAVTWDSLREAGTIILCVTHGHPEHVGTLRALLELPEARPYLARVHLISSEAVTRHINASGLLAPEQVHAVRDGEQIAINGVQIAIFTWVHMPLLPPGFRASAEYILQLALHPLDLLRIGWQSLRLPLNAPQFGFHITYPDGATVLNYSEGVHRLTNAAEVQQVARDLPAETLLFAVEPDDAQAIPRWVEMLAPKAVVIYEAHRPWRDLFRLPFIDLEEYAGVLAGRFAGIAFRALITPGQTISDEG